MVGDNKSRKGRKSFKFGGKQKHGTSRSAYFARAEYVIAKNRRRRIEKEAKRQEECRLKRELKKATRLEL